MSGLTIELLTPEHRPALELFLDECDDACVFHQPAWHDAIHESYGHRCDYWIARTDQRVVAAFPVVHVRVPLLGSKMVAMAYQMHSGMPIGTSAAHAPLVQQAVERARALGTRYLEIRHFRPADWLETFGFRRAESGLCTTIVPLEHMSLTMVRRNHRRRLLAAEEQGVHVRAADSTDDLRVFRELYRREGRELGAPQAAWRFFSSVRRQTGPLYRLYLAEREGRIIGGLYTLGDRHMCFARNAAYATSEARAVDAGRALYWHAINDATRRGVRWFNCGLSWVRDTGLIQWKEGWGGATHPVCMYVLSLRGQPPSPGAYFEGYRAAKAVWRHLPLPLVDFLGHQVTRWVG